MHSKSKKIQIVILVLAAAIIFETALLVKFWPRKPKVVIKPKAKIEARIAIIIDDWGYNLTNIDFLKEVGIPLDISVLPFLPYSKEIAEEAHLNAKEVMLHLPLEPHPNTEVSLESRVILVNMNHSQVQKILSDAIKNVPYCQGINNHMGSLATEKKDLMSVIFNEMKKENLFFVDSLVTQKSICKEAAKQAQIKFGQRSVFLDNQSDSQYIRKQFSYLIKKAKRQGFAIGIGHDHPLTLKTIKELAPEMEKQGIKFVFVSEVVK